MDSRPLSEKVVAIVGLGLMGGSLAMALRGKCAALIAVDPDAETRRLAIENGVVDAVSASPVDFLHGTDLVVLAAPVLAIIDLLEQLPELHPGSPVVMDLGSTKTEIVRSYAHLPSRFDPLPAHPMCGRETAGLANATPGMFKDSILVFTPLEHTSAHAREIGNQLAAAMGARSTWLTPERHDAWVARTSHIPYLLSTALAASLPMDAGPLIGPGFRSTARLAGSDPAMMTDILLTNRMEIQAGLAALRAELDALDHLLLEPGNGEVLRQKLAQTQLKYLELLESVK